MVSLFEERHRRQLVSIWKEAFLDSDEYINKFFDSSCAKTFVYLENDNPIGMVSVFDVFLDNKKGAYLYALAVDEKHRGKNVASILLKKVQDTLLKSDYNFSLVVPSPYDSLENFYKKRGFTKELRLGVTRFDRKEPKTEFTFEKATEFEYQAARKKLDNIVIHSDSFYDYIYNDMLVDGAEVIKIFIDTKEAFCICYNKGKYVIIKEMLGEIELNRVAQAVMSIFNVPQAVCLSSNGATELSYALLNDFRSELTFGIYANLLLDSLENRF